MTILTFLWRFTIGGAWPAIKASPITRLLVKIAGIALAVLTFGAWQRRQGAQGEKAKAATKAMKEDLKAHERINEADLGIGATDDERVKRLREFAAKHGK